MASTRRERAVTAPRGSREIAALHRGRGLAFLGGMGSSRTLGAASILLAACGGSGAFIGVSADAGGDEAPPIEGGALADAGSSDASPSSDAGAARRFRLASTGLQLVLSGPAVGFQLTPANLADDVDVASVHQEFYGVPWNELATHAPLPGPWVAHM